jgi:hypothetical protein
MRQQESGSFGFLSHHCHSTKSFPFAHYGTNGRAGSPLEYLTGLSKNVKTRFTRREGSIPHKCTGQNMHFYHYATPGR